jgi:hypothetical protein
MEWAKKSVCKAFPNEIPWEILINNHDHHKPYPGDNSIRFEPRDGEYDPGYGLTNAEAWALFEENVRKMEEKEKP